MMIASRTLPVAVSTAARDLAAVGGKTGRRSGQMLSLPTGSVTATLRCVRRRFASRRATYQLRVGNETATPVEAFTYAVRSLPSDEPICPNAVVVPPDGTTTLDLEVVVPVRGRYRVVTEIHARHATFVFEETPAPRRSRAFASLAGVAALAAGCLALVTQRPHVSALAAPQTVDASRPFDVAYAFDHGERGSYVVTALGGTVVDRGSLDPRGGSFTLALPVANATHEYDVSVATDGRFGSDARTVRIVGEIAPEASLALPAPVAPARPPRRIVRTPRLTIARMTLEHDTVAGGEPLRVTYLTPASAGVVRLIDQVGTVRAEAPLSTRGDTLLVTPLVEADQDFRVIVHAAHGTDQAEATLPVRITKAFSMDDVVAAARKASDGPIVLAASRVASGDEIHVGIVQHEPGLRVTLVDSHGAELGGSDVPADADAITLAAPAVTAPATYTVVATFAHGTSQETVVRSLAVGGPAPAPSSAPSVTVVDGASSAR